MNLHTAIFFRLVKIGIGKYKPTPSHEIPLPSAPPDPNYAKVPIQSLGSKVKVLAKDEDEPVRPKILKAIIQMNNRFSPLVDTNKPWDSREYGKQSVQSVFGGYLPKCRVDWNRHDPASDEALRWWVFSGFGALELRQLDESAAKAEQVNGIVPRFVSSYEFLNDYPVRPGMCTYGGAVYLDGLGNPLKIKLRGKDIFPYEGTAWEAAKFAYRSTSLVWVTLYHHLFFSHYTVSNSGVLATLHTLPTDNPLRLLLKPFLFRTAAINNGGADSLLPKGSAFFRASAFTWESMEALYELMLQKTGFQPLDSLLKERGVDQESLKAFSTDIFPYGRDGELFWKSLTNFSSDILHNAPAFRDIEKRDEIKNWWEEMCQSLHFSSKDLSRENLASFLGQFFYTVSGFHSWVGHVAPYVVDPSVASGKLFPEAIMANQQSSTELGVIASVTGLPTPDLLGDFSHLMPDKYTRHSLGRLHDEMKDIGREIHRRNAGRQIPLQAFLPEELNLSVAI